MPHVLSVRVKPSVKREIVGDKPQNTRQKHRPTHQPSRLSRGPSRRSAGSRTSASVE